MELELKNGKVYRVEMPTSALPELSGFDSEDFASYIMWIFLPSGIPGINDVTAMFGFDINCKQNFFIDEWTARENEDPQTVIERYINAAVEVLRLRGILQEAIIEHQKELAEDII